MSAKKYDSTVARIAGNIASGLNLKITLEPHEAGRDAISIAAELSVKLARAIIAEVERTDQP